MDNSKSDKERWTFSPSCTRVNMVWMRRPSHCCESLPRISEEANEEMEASLTSKNVHTVLQGMQGGRALGIYDLTPTFDKVG